MQTNMDQRLFSLCFGLFLQYFTQICKIGCKLLICCHHFRDLLSTMATGYDPPSWAGKPSVGLHLDVLKETKLIQKFMIDEKKCYLFGRNPQMNDFCIDHGSCSRVHAALVWHKHLERSFLVDLGSSKLVLMFGKYRQYLDISAHGTFIGNFRIEANKPTQLPVDSTFRFGESTRKYIMRERPKVSKRKMRVAGIWMERLRTWSAAYCNRQPTSPPT